MSTLNQPENFKGRVAYASAVIARQGGHTRAFDNCFENHDGDEVAVAVYRRSLKNPRIAANLNKYLCGVALESAIRQLADVCTRDLPEHARQSRLKANEEFEKLLAERDRRNQSSATL